MKRRVAWEIPCALATAVLLAGLVGCGPGSGGRSSSAPPAKSPASGTKKGEKTMAIQVTSTAFADGERIPVQYTGEGEDVSPPIAWSGLPEGTKELALICDDPDAPTDEPWVHWVIYKIPANATGLPEGVPRQARLKDTGMLQGQTSWPQPSVGYRGPMPPKGHGEHHYQFTLYALGGKLVVQPGITKNQLLTEMEDHVLGTGQLVGIYSR